jgi:hypothetical protein
MKRFASITILTPILVLSAAIALSPSRSFGQDAPTKKAPAKKAAKTTTTTTVTETTEDGDSERTPSKKRERKQGLIGEFSGQGYGMAGCGLGSIFFGEMPGIVQIFAGTTNDFYSNNTFGVTLGTSNCVPDQAGEMAAQMFLDSNRQTMENDVARGGGETLEAFFDIAGCGTSRSQVGELLQKNYEGIFRKDAAASQVVKSIRQTIRQNQSTAQSCLNLG